METLVSYDLATLTFREALGAHLRSRFPRARFPIARWVVSVLAMILGLALIGFIVGMAAWPRFNVESMALGFGIIGAIVSLLTATRVQRALGRFRKEGTCTTELSEEGILRRTKTVECKYRWIPGQEFLRRGDDVLLFLRRDELLWLPRRAFSSDDVIDSFLRTARCYHAKAMQRGDT